MPDVKRELHELRCAHYRFLASSIKNSPNSGYRTIEQLKDLVEQQRRQYEEKMKQLGI